MIGVLLMSFGTPDSPEDVPEFYTFIRNGQRPSDAAIADLQRRYRAIGGRSPLTAICRRLAKRLDDRLFERGFDARVYLGMKNWHPLIRDVVPEIVRDGIQQVIAIPLAPHYTTVSTGAYRESLELAAADSGPVDLIFVERWGNCPRFLDGVADQVRSALASFPDSKAVSVLFTAHSIPERYVRAGERYVEELTASVRVVAAQVRLEHWELAFQSARTHGGPWLGPDLLGRLRALADEGQRAVLVVPIGFIADHLEILYDLDVEARQVAHGLGIELRRTAMLNEAPSLVEALADIAIDALAGASRPHAR